MIVLFFEQRTLLAQDVTVLLNEIKSLSFHLPPGMSTQLAELEALRRTLILRANRQLNVYIDSTYVYLVLYIHVAVWKENHLLTTNESPTKRSQKMA